MVELGQDLNPVLQPDPISPFNLSALSVSTGTNPLPSSEPLVNTIDDFSIPNAPQAVDLSDFISGGGTGATDPYSAVINIANTPNSESDIAIYNAKPYTFASGYKQTNFNRYYNDKDNFYKLGFSPFANNEETYNSNRSWYEDLGRAASGIPGLGLSFLKSIYGADIGDEYAEANALYGSTKGGVAGFTSNLTLNLAPVLAIGVDWYITNAGLAALGTIPGLQGIAGGGIAVKTASTVDKFKDLITTFSSAQKMREAFTFANVSRNVGNVLYKITPYAETGKAIFETAKAVGQGEKLINAARTAKNVGTFIRDSKQFSYAMGEANLEGDMSRNDFIDARINEFIKENNYYPSEDELDEIYKLGEDVKFTTSMFNMPILYLSNAIVFDNLYRGSTKSLFRPANQYVKNFTKTGVSVVIEDGTAKVVSGLKENLKFAAKGLVQPQKYGKFALNYFGANLAEGLQEVTQEAISGASEDYYKELYNTNEAGGISMYMGSFYDNLKKQMSAEGGEVFLSGFLLGGLASVGGSAIGGATDAFTNQYNKNFRKDYNDLYKSDSEAAKEIADNINLAMSDGYKIFTPDIENLLVQIKLGKDMTEAKLNYDEKAFHDLKDAARFNAIYTVLQTGNFDNLLNKLENMKESTGAELKEAFELDESVTEEEAKKVLDVTIDRAKQIQNQYQQVSDIQNPFNPSRYKKSEITNPEVKRQYETEVQGYYGFEDARKQAVFNAHAAGQASKRMADLVSNLSSIAEIGKLSFTDIKNILDIDSLNDELDTLEMELSNLSEAADPKLKQIRKAKESKRKALQSFKKEFEKIQSLEDASLIEKKKALKNAFSKYLTKLAEENNLTVPSNKIDEAFAMLSDYYALSKDLRRFNSNVAAMADPQIFYNQVARNINVRKELVTNIGNISKDLFDKFLNSKKAQDLINELHDLGFVISLESIPMLDGTYEQLYEYLTTDPDIKFIDLKSGVVFSITDPRYQTIKDTVENYNEEVKKQEETKPEETEVETKTETEEETKEPVSEILTEDGVPLIQSLAQFNSLPLNLQGLLRSSLSQQNSAREADGEPELPLDRFLRTASSRRIISKYFKDPNNAADIKVYNEKKKPAEPTKTEPVKTTPTQSTNSKAEIERRTTKIISSEIVEKGNRKGQTRTVSQTNFIEDVDGTLLSTTEYEAKVGDTTVTLGGKSMTFKEFKEEFPLDEDYEEIFADWPDLNDDSIITVRKVTRTPSNSRFKTVVSIFSPVLGGKMDVTIKKDDVKYNAEVDALEQPKEDNMVSSAKAYVKEVFTQARDSGRSGYMKRVREKLTQVKDPTLTISKKYARVVTDEEGNVTKVEIVTGTGKSFEYTFMSGYTGSGTTKSTATNFPTFIDESGKESGVMAPERLGYFFELPNDQPTDARTEIERRRQEELNWKRRIDNSKSKEELLKVIEDISGRTSSDMSIGFNAAIVVPSQFSEAKRIAIQDLKDIEKFFLKGINAKYDAELARELYKEIKAGKLVTDMSPAEQKVANEYITEELRKSVDAELTALQESVIETEVVTDPLQPFLDKINKANTIQDINNIEEEFSETDLTDEVDNLNAMREAIALKKQELTKSVKYDGIKPKDVLVLGNNKYGLVEKVTSTKLTVVPLYGERMTPAKDANKRITILKKDFSKMVKSVYDTQANIEIGVKDVPAPSTEEKKIIETNSQNIDDFLDNEEATKKLEDETNNKSEKDVNNDFFNNIGC
jgi:hypothetical protein